MTNPQPMPIRPWRDSDRDGLDDLLASNADLIWREQFHPLHGPDRHVPFRRTLVAASDRIIGAATIATSPIHTQGVSCAIEVHPDQRRQGHGTALLRALGQQFPEHIPFRTKVRSDDFAAIRFLQSVSGHEYQRANGEEVDLNTAALRWAHQQPIPEGVWLGSLRSRTETEAVEAFAHLYIWTHALWNPVGDEDALRSSLMDELVAAEPDLSVIAADTHGIVALALAFPAQDRVLDVVAETVRVGQAHGTAILATMIAQLAVAAASAGWNTLAFDGHPTDPHLALVLSTMPVSRTSPLLLMEITE